MYTFHPCRRPVICSILLVSAWDCDVQVSLSTSCALSFYLPSNARSFHSFFAHDMSQETQLSAANWSGAESLCIAKLEDIIFGFLLCPADTLSTPIAPYFEGLQTTGWKYFGDPCLANGTKFLIRIFSGVEVDVFNGPKAFDIFKSFLCLCSMNFLAQCRHPFQVSVVLEYLKLSIFSSIFPST